MPIVSGACLFDLAFANPNVRPTAADGARACALALDNAPTPLPRGNVGAGCGCTVGKLGGPTRAMKSGLGTDVEQAGPLLCGAVAAVNACGNVVDPDTREVIAGMRSQDGTGFVDECELALSMAARMPLDPGHDGSARPPVRTNTTISCVITNARLTKARPRRWPRWPRMPMPTRYGPRTRPTTETPSSSWRRARSRFPWTSWASSRRAPSSARSPDGARSAKTSHGLVGAASL